MPTIPVNTALGFIGFVLVLAGGFLLLTGLGIIGVEKVTVKPGRPTWMLGLAFAVLGILLISFSEPLKQGGNTVAPVNNVETNIATIVTATSSPTNNTSLSEGTPISLYEQAKGWPLEVHDVFDRNDANWWLEPLTSGHTQEIKNGELICSYAPTTELPWYWYLSPYDSYSDFFVSVKTRYSGAFNHTYYGLVFRRQGNKFYLFRLNDFDSYAVHFVENNNWTEIIGWTKTNVIKPEQFNELAVVAIGPQLTFFINQRELGSVTDTLSSLGNIGFTSSTQEISDTVNFEFDDLEVRVKP